MNSSVVIRPAVTGDLMHVAALENTVFHGNAYPPFFFRQALDVFAELFLVAVDHEGVVMGYILGGYEWGAEAGWMMSLAVGEEYRKRGIARKLMGRLFRQLHDHGAGFIKLTVEPDNEPAIIAYRKNGFREIAREDDYFGPGESRIVMWREI